MTLPIYLPKFEPEHWQQIERQLLAIAAKERIELAPRDRLVNNSLFLVQGYVKSNEWNALFRFLSERNIIAINNVVAPPKKVSAPPKQPKSPKPPKPDSSLPKKKRLQALLDKILLADELTTLLTIQNKLAGFGLKITDDICREYLHEFHKRGLIFSCHSYGSRKALYALNQTGKIHEDEWFTSTYALVIARENGYKGLDSYFRQYPYTQRNRKVKPFDFYAQYNLEYREVVKGDKETSYCKFRILVKEIDAS